MHLRYSLSPPPLAGFATFHGEGFILKGFTLKGTKGGEVSPYKSSPEDRNLPMADKCLLTFSAFGLSPIFSKVLKQL
jgi:hypothetical protein